MVSAEEKRELLDSPHVSKEDKEAILRGLVVSGDLEFVDAMQISERQGLEPDGISPFGTNGLLENVYNKQADEAADRARSAHTKGEEQAQTNQELGESWDALNSGTAFGTSDEIIDQGIVGLKIFDMFHPRFVKAGGQDNAQQTGDVGVAALDPDSLRATCDELREIDFNAFGTDADSLNQVVSGVDDSRNVLTQAWSNNLASWTGGAAEAANQYKAKFDGAIATLDAGMKPIPGAITTTADTIRQQVTDFAKRIHNLYGDGKMGAMTVEEVDGALEGRDKLPGVIDELQRKADELANRGVLDRVVDFFGDLAAAVVGFLVAGPIGAIAAVTGLEFAKEINEDNINEELAKYRQALTSIEQRLQQFVQDYSTKASSVHEQMQTAAQGITETYNTLFTTATGDGKLQTNPFEQLGTAPDFEDAQSGGGGGSGGGGSGGGGGGTGGGGSGGGGGGMPAGGGGGTPAGGGGGMPPGGGGGMPPGGGGGAPPDIGGPPPDAAGATTPAGADPSQPGIDPLTGQPMQPGGQPETVTIKDGQREISVQSPDGQGHVKLTVDDGTGQPKTYDLDFGAATGEPGAGVPGQPGQPLPPGAPGAPGGLPGQPGVEQAVAGPDGKCVIQDGELTITAERPPGSPDQVVVTVEDGSGEPTTYTLDYQDPANPQVVDGGQSPGQPQPAFATGQPVEPAGGAGVAGQAFAAPAAAADFASAGAPAGAEPLAQPVASAEPAQVTSTQAADGGAFGGGAGGGSGMWSASGDLFGDSGAGQNGGQLGDSSTAYQASAPGEAGLASAHSEPSSAQQGGGGAPMMGGGMGAMGGMGAGGGGGGGDEQRAGSTWTLVGNLFDDAIDNTSEQISGALGHERQGS